jgi:hypothetical protein
MLAQISLVTTINKYVQYLSESPEMNSQGPGHVSAPRLFISGDSDKYWTYLLIVVTRLIVTWPSLWPGSVDKCPGSVRT